jgi:aspartyl-tRNA(Asn)/glutamyl-tRNA(Gln) amidotransferase subunit B
MGKFDTIINAPTFQEWFIGFLKKIEEGKITKVRAERHLRAVIGAIADPTQIGKEGLFMEELTEGKKTEVDIEPLIKRVLEDNPRAIEDHKAGKPKIIDFLIGKTIKLSNGLANPIEVRKKLEQKLEVN